MAKGKDLAILAGVALAMGAISQRTKAGAGLSRLGGGIKQVTAAPLSGVGLGLSNLAGGIRSIGESFGDIGRGLGSIFKAIPTKLPDFSVPGPPGGQNGGLPKFTGNGNGNGTGRPEDRDKTPGLVYV